jgi:hypothetical protein
MGFEEPIQAFKLVFAETELAGLEVTARSLPIEEFLKLSEMASAKDDPKTIAASAGDVFRTLAGALLEWNLTRNGEPVPATYEGIISCGLDFIMKIVRAWLTAMSGVDENLGKDSSSGTTSGPVPSLPMEPLSPAPQS